MRKVWVMLVLGIAGLAGAEQPVDEPSGASLFWTSADELVAQARQLVHEGQLARAEQLLAGHPRLEEPATARVCAEGREIIRRIRLDYSQTEAALLEKLRRTLPEVTAEDLERWRRAGQAQARVLDGQLYYFVREPTNIFLFCEEARQWRARQQGRPLPAPGEPGEKDRKLLQHLREVVDAARRTGRELVLPVRHLIRYTLTVAPDRPGARPGARVRCWLPFPQEYRQQSGVKLLKASPGRPIIAPNVIDGWPLGGAPQRTVYLEQTVTDPARPVEFAVEFEYVSHAYYPQLDESRARPLPAGYHGGFLAERPPHIVFTPQIRAAVSQIVGEEPNPLARVRRIFRWISQNHAWAAEQEYAIIPNLSEKLFLAGRGDCGTFSMLFITMCRCAGVPARWQSGWQTFPADWNMHDWAEFYVEPWGWLPADPSYGLKPSPDPELNMFYCGHQDAYRLIVNLDYGSPLHPPKEDLRSEPADFQRGEVEIDGRNLYFDEWDYRFQFELQPLHP